MVGRPRSNRRLKDLTLIGGPLLAALAIGLVLAPSQASHGSTGYQLATVNFVTPVLITVVTLFTILYGLRHYGDKAARLVLAGISIGGTISGLVLLQLWIATLENVPIVFYILAAPMGYTGLYLSVRNYTNSLSASKSSLLMLTSVTLIGSLVGLLFPTPFTIAMLLAFSFLDVIIVETDLLRKTVGLIRIDEMISLVTLPLSEFDIGLGDFLAYSIMAAASLKSGILTASATLVLTIVGMLVSIRITRTRMKMPGLSLPIWLGLLPIIIGLLT